MKRLLPLGHVVIYLVSSNPRLSMTWGPVRAPRIVAASTRLRLPFPVVPPDGANRRTRGGTVDVIVERAGGLDVHKRTVSACMRLPDESGGRRQVRRTFKTFSADLTALADW